MSELWKKLSILDEYKDYDYIWVSNYGEVYSTKSKSIVGI